MELESIIALDVLSIYEYAQRGNLKKMQSRSGQALISAMGLSIHMHSGDDEYAEARRRVWWMTYLCATQAYVVGNSKPSFSVFAPSFTAEYPTLPSDPEAFTILIRSQQAILASTQFVIDLKTAMATHSDMTPIYDRMTELDRNLDPLIAASDAWILPGSTTTPVDFSEVAVSRALRGIARIKLNSARIKVHRYCAFFDLPVFTQKHCDLGAKEPADNGGGGDSLDVGSWPFCSTATLMARPDAAVATSYPASGGSGSSHFAPSTSSPGGSSSAHSSPCASAPPSTSPRPSRTCPTRTLWAPPPRRRRAISRPPR
ncbi:hypothetical protein VTK73DRAFT_5186 [Phialemonium thermophilum]|uniref:Transcription factor domain-containing protein n=1 Tax=Phialemonium thermophilum TaxID=223376 RepID=A0ABR3V4G6_9PEZI